MILSELPFVPEKVIERTKLFGIPLKPDHVFFIATLDFVDCLLKVGRDNKLLLKPYRLVELEIPQSFLVAIPVAPLKIRRHRWLGWYNSDTETVDFELHILMPRREDIAKEPNFKIKPHHAWTVPARENLLTIERTGAKQDYTVLPQSDRGDGVIQVYLIGKHDDPGQLTIKEYNWRPPGFQPKIMEG